MEKQRIPEGKKTMYSTQQIVIFLIVQHVLFFVLYAIFFEPSSIRLDVLFRLYLHTILIDENSC